MKKHRHCEMIKAKAEDMDLVVFARKAYGGDWAEVDSKENIPTFNQDNEYFLCLPEHNENGQCLHWLSGGAVFDEYSNEVEDVLPHKEYGWHPLHHFMCEDAILVIKHDNHNDQKKQKRWIGIQGNGCTTQHYETRDELIASLIKPSEWNLIEIEL